MDQQKEKTNSSKIRSVKRKSKFKNCSSRENDKTRKKLMRHNFGEDEKEQLKKDDKKTKKCVITSRKKKKERLENKDDKRKKAKMITLR